LRRHVESTLWKVLGDEAVNEPTPPFAVAPRRRKVAEAVALLTGSASHSLFVLDPGELH
jgi:hypothetical protein